MSFAIPWARSARHYRSFAIGDSVLKPDQQYLFPRRRRIKRHARRLVNRVIELLRTPIRRHELLVVTGRSNAAKASEVESRLRSIFDHLRDPPKLTITARPRVRDYLRYTALAAADSSAIPSVAQRSLQWIYDVDYEVNEADGWALCELGYGLLPASERRSNYVTARETFIQRVTELKNDRPGAVYLLGTGPSLALAARRRFDDGITIVCNTIVRDPDLFAHLNPSFLTAGDAIYHFGHNPHARAFRADALRRLQEAEGATLFVYPAPFDVVVRDEFSEVESLLVPIPWGEHTNVVTDLTEEFSLPDVENVLAALLLPLGCTLARDVRLWGFDGRAPNDVGFWANSSQHAYPELMQSIRDAHPAFFQQKTPTGNEAKYVNAVHGEFLDERLSAAEERGFRFRMLHSTWTPTLQKRYVHLE